MRTETRKSGRKALQCHTIYTSPAYSRHRFLSVLYALTLAYSFGEPPRSVGQDMPRKGKERKGKEIGKGKSKHRRRKAILKLRWINFGAILAHVAHLGPILEPFWASLGPSWGCLETILGHFVAILSHLRAILGHLGAVLRPFWGLLGPS